MSATFDPRDVDDNALALALVQLRPGEHGPAQPRAVRVRLVALEDAGLAAWTTARGWRLTALGKARAAWLSAQARRAARKVSP